MKHRRRRLARLRRKHARVPRWLQSHLAKKVGVTGCYQAPTARDIMQSAGFAQFYSADGVTTRRASSKAWGA
jgi:hypothetical protein